MQGITLVICPEMTYRRLRGIQRTTILEELSFFHLFPTEMNKHGVNVGEERESYKPNAVLARSWGIVIAPSHITEQ